MIVPELLSSCCDAVVRWLDCVDCRQAGAPCQAIVCVDCGTYPDDVYEPGNNATFDRERD